MYVYDLDAIAEKFLDEESERYSKLKDGYLIHATLEDNIDSILANGLLPRGISGCYVWSDERVPMGVDVEEVLICRENNVYFWDDLYEGLAQGIATVGYLKHGNPAVLIVDVRDIRDKLRYDPEVHRGEEPEPEEPTSYMYEGVIPPEKIICVCRIDDEYKPDMGKVACPIMHHEEGECPKYDVESIYDEFVYDWSKWVCECREKI